MSLIELFLVAVGLSMDAFAVAICKGLSMKELSLKKMLIPGLYFGGFQGLMPLIGYLLGSQFADKIMSFDHWIAFILLAVIGAGMIKESRSEETEGGDGSVHFSKMLPLAVATSIDALAIGVSFAFLDVHIISAVSLIAVITFVLSVAGIRVGNEFGIRFKSKAELAGGLILILMGLKILITHLMPTL